MQAFNLAFLGVIIPMVLIVLCCIISVICGQCRGTVSGRGTNGGIRTGGRLGNHARNQNVYSNKIYTISGGNSGSYGGDFGGCDFGGASSGGCDGGFGGSSGGCGGDSGGCGV